ncbi:hypothetical protein OROGR_008950 [Orobanche gracilis]
MDIDMLIQKYSPNISEDEYPNIPKDQFHKIREISQYPAFNEHMFLERISSLGREKLKLDGRKSILAGPLLQLLSVHILPNDQNLPLTVFGRIFAQLRDASNGNLIVHDFYSRTQDNPQVLGRQNHTLELICPDFNSSQLSFNAMPLHETKLVVDVYVGGNRLLGEFVVGEDVNDFEQVKLEHVHCDLASLALRYNFIPFAVYGRVEINFLRKKGYKSDQVHDSLNLKGKIVARYGDTFGGCASEEFTLFDKQSNEFERVEFGSSDMRLSRCWVALPAYSPLIIDLDLWELETEQKILKETVEMRFEEVWGRNKFIVDDMLVTVGMSWFSPQQQGMMDDDDDESSSEDEGDVEQENEICVPEASSKRMRPWRLGPHKDMPLSSSSVQIFSIYIGREKLKALQIYGSIEVTSPACAFYVFNRDANDAFQLSEHSKTLPILRICGPHDQSETMKIKFNLKDLDGHVNIRGYVEWHWSCFNHYSSSLDKQLCSVVQGQQGFAAIHYSLFSEAVQANIEVLCISKNEDADFPSKVYGSLVAR